MNKIQKVPKNFMDMSIIKYPPHQKSKNIEAKIYLEIINNQNLLNSNLIYLPIQWTNYLVKNRYGKDVSELQNYINTLPKSKKYFSVIQYAGGPLIDIDNIIFFSAGGFFNTETKPNLSYMPIPLISDNHKKFFSSKKKKYLASYIGRKTHKVREDLEILYSTNINFYIKNLKNMDINFRDLIMFKSIMSNSIFSICPQGFGPTSFRLYEAIQMGTIPVYIAEENKHFLPFRNKIDWNKLAIILNSSEIDQLEEKLLKIVENNDHLEKLEYGRYCQNNFFNFKFISNEIINTVNNF